MQKRILLSLTYSASTILALLALAHISRHAAWLAGWLLAAGWLADGWLAGRLAGWLAAAGWLASRLTGCWLAVCCLANKARAMAGWLAGWLPKKLRAAADQNKIRAMVDQHKIRATYKQ